MCITGVCVLSLVGSLEGEADVAVAADEVVVDALGAQVLNAGDPLVPLRGVPCAEYELPLGLLLNALLSISTSTYLQPTTLYQLNISITIISEVFLYPLAGMQW